MAQCRTFSTPCLAGTAGKILFLAAPVFLCYSSFLLGISGTNRKTCFFRGTIRRIAVLCPPVILDHIGSQDIWRPSLAARHFVFIAPQLLHESLSGIIYAIHVCIDQEGGDHNPSLWSALHMGRT